jgi:hypothetical protein
MNTRFTVSQIMDTVNHVEGGFAVQNICRIFKELELNLWTNLAH